MELNLVREMLETRKPGVFTTINYLVDCPVKAEYKKLGIQVRKNVTTKARFNINYKNIASVKERLSNEEDKKPRANNYVPIVANLLYHNTNTDKDYLNVYTIKGNHSKRKYEVNIPSNGLDVWHIWSEDRVREEGFLINSYFSGKSGENEMYRINVNNILSINGNAR